MKVLWFAVTPSMYAANTIGHNGGGWIASLEALVRKVPGINLGVAFEYPDTCFRADKDGVTYYPINIWESKWRKIKSKFKYDTEQQLLIPACLKVIDDFKPDIIHVFGSEWSFGLLTQFTKIPIVIHMQGSIPPYYNSRFPAGYSSNDFFFNYGFNIAKVFRKLIADKYFKLRSNREEIILRNCHYYMGRTEWDRNLTRLYAPNSKYYHCDEVIRQDFINPTHIWQIKNASHYIIVTTISPPLYKGVDVILKAAKLLKQNTLISFEWRVFGINEIKYHETNTKINASDVSVKMMGTVASDVLKDELLNADVFIHPSYIDNSPNSVCEAQLLGLPVISTNVGGISSIVEHNETGLLVPSNDPFTTVSYIIKIFNDKSLAANLGKKARKIALQRHDPEQIVKSLLDIYNDVLNDSDSINNN